MRSRKVFFKLGLVLFAGILFWSLSGCAKSEVPQPQPPPQPKPIEDPQPAPGPNPNPLPEPVPSPNPNPNPNPDPVPPAPKPNDPAPGPVVPTPAPVAPTPEPTTAADLVNSEERAFLKAQNPGRDDQFGASVAVSGSRIVVGAPSWDSNVVGKDGWTKEKDDGAIYVFVREGNTWRQEAFIPAPDPINMQEFGRRVSISGDRIIAHFETSTTDVKSQLIFYVRDGEAWKEESRLAGSQSCEGIDGFALSGDTVVVQHTARLWSSSKKGFFLMGEICILSQEGGDWREEAHFESPERDDNFGASLSISVDQIVVGTPSANFKSPGGGLYPVSGAAYVFTREGGVWKETIKLTASNPGAWDRFGMSVSILEDWILVGSPGEDSHAQGINGDQNSDKADDSGAAYLFHREGGAWRQVAYVKASSTHEFGDAFGSSVVLLKDFLVVGAPRKDVLKGGIYLFTREGEGWAEKNRLTASNAGFFDRFGASLAVSTDTLVVGAPDEGTDSAGIKTNAGEDPGALNDPKKFGAIYIFQ